MFLLPSFCLHFYFAHFFLILCSYSFLIEDFWKVAAFLLYKILFFNCFFISHFFLFLMHLSSCPDDFLVLFCFSHFFFSSQLFFFVFLWYIIYTRFDCNFEKCKFSLFLFPTFRKCLALFLINFFNKRTFPNAVLFSSKTLIIKSVFYIFSLFSLFPSCSRFRILSIWWTLSGSFLPSLVSPFLSVFFLSLGFFNGYLFFGSIVSFPQYLMKVLRTSPFFFNIVS